ncbi:MAG: hypothetical protein C5B53_06245 [Candidatus Melainabacteria bacterium]|nr:MAG: hypothetical protein C5B53_06245 [Candidatus Melainabacteria bacterium]
MIQMFNPGTEAMLNEIHVGGDTYTAEDKPLRLLEILRRHLDKSLIVPESVDLNDREVLALKSWLLRHAEAMKPGKAVWIEERSRGEKSRLVVAIGKTDEGTAIVWHEPLPWPFDPEPDHQDGQSD